MKRYIRTKGGMFIDATKTTVFVKVDAGFPQLCIEDPDIARCLTVCVERESNNIIDLIQVGDLIEDNSFASLQFVTPSLIDLIEDRVENYNVKTPEDLSITKIYTKHYDKYILVWDSERGVV